MTCDIWYVTCETWQVTHYMWHIRCDMWHVMAGLNILSKFLHPSSYGLWFMIFWRFGGKGRLTDPLTDWFNQLRRCFWTAPPTLGLLKTCKIHISSWNKVSNFLVKHQSKSRATLYQNLGVVFGKSIHTKKKFSHSLGKYIHMGLLL